MYEARYFWKHLPSGAHGERTRVVRDGKQMETDIAHWNGQQPGTWQYSWDGNLKWITKGGDI